MSKNSLKPYYSAMEIAAFKLNSAPHSHKNVQAKAKREGWIFRKRECRGGGLEYKFSSLPQEVQTELLLKHAQTTAVELADKGKSSKKAKALNYLPDVIWAGFDKATEQQRQKAKEKLALIVAVADLVENGAAIMDAINLVAKQHNEAVGSLKRWYYKVRSFERSDWLPLLLGKQGKNRQAYCAEFTPAAWEFFKADYFRNEEPQFAVCYQRLKRAAVKNDWQIPSASSVKRKIQREIPMVQQVYLRKGEHALSQYYPSQRRSVADLEAFEWVNGDGYQHNVFVKWHNGEIVRPKTWIWQDIRTRKILAYRTDVSENSDCIRLALMDLVYKYGIPKHLTIDNTRAAANKWLTGGVPNRFRFKVKDDDVKGIIPLLGIELHWTSIQFGKGHGQAKPIERAFSHGGLGETVDKHPSLAGFYAGSSVTNQPDNYNGGKAGIDYETFILALEAGIQQWNETEGRNTELCQGIYSFEQVWQRDYAQARVRKASTEQLRILMLMSEAVTLKKDGTFELSCGGKVQGRQNRYLAIDLIGSHYKKVVVRFDPQQLHSDVWVYSLEGEFLAQAICQEAIAFGDKATGREHDRLRKQFTRENKKAAQSQIKMDTLEVNRLMPEVALEEEPTEPKIIELVKMGNTVRKVTVDKEEDTMNEFEQSLQRGLTRIK